MTTIQQHGWHAQQVAAKAHRASNVFGTIGSFIAWGGGILTGLVILVPVVLAVGLQLTVGRKR